MSKKGKKRKTEATEEETSKKIEEMFPEGKGTQEVFDEGEGSVFCGKLRVGSEMLRGDESVDLRS